MPKAKYNKNGLTVNQQLVADKWLADEKRNGTKAYMEVYGIKNEKSAMACASRLLNNAKVSAYIDKRLAELQKKVEYDQEQWLADQLKIKNICMGETSSPRAVIVGDKQVEVDVKEFDASGANRSQELLGKFLRILTDKSDASQRVQVNFQLNLTGK